MVIKVENIKSDAAGRLAEIRGVVARSLSGRLHSLWLFGSYTRGEETPLSDLDLAYLPARGLTEPELERLDADLFRVLSRTLGTDEITLINLNEAPVALSFSVLWDGVLLFASADSSDLKEWVLAHYPDARRLRQETLGDFAQGLGGSPMQIDREKVLYQLRLLQADLEKLRETMTLVEDEYLADFDRQIIVERKFQTAIESCVNIGNHLIARLNLRLAEDYASVFQVLGEANIIPQNVAEKMMDMARFRNLLVHLYWGIDHKRVYKTMKSRMESLESFRQAIFEFLKRSKDS